MNCQEFREQLDAALDDRRVVSRQTNVAGDTDVVAHVESCPDCRVLHEKHLLIESALAVWTPRRPAVDLTDRVIEAARQEGLISSNGSAVAANIGGDGMQVGVLGSADSPYVLTKARATDNIFYRRSVMFALAAGALILLTSSLAFYHIIGRDMANKTDQIQEPFPDQQPRLLDSSQDQLADISHLVADAQSAWRGITSRVSHQASGFGVFVPDLKSELGISVDAELLNPDPEGSGSDAEPRDSVEPSAVEKAFEFLFDNESAGTLTI